MNVVIKKSKKKVIPFLCISTAMLIYFGYLYFTDSHYYVKGKSFYLPAMAISALGLLYCGYDFLDNRSLYIIDETGIFSRRNKKLFLWTDFTCYKSEISFNTYLTTRVVKLYNINERVLLIIDLTSTDAILEKVENSLGKRLSKKV